MFAHNIVYTIEYYYVPVGCLPLYIGDAWLVVWLTTAHVTA